LKNRLYCDVFFLLTHIFTMSQHNSFKALLTGSSKKRTVLKRYERVELLKKRGEWKEGDSVVGLKKTMPEE